MSHYGTVEDFEAYIEARAIEIPANTHNDDIKAALLIASEWLDNVFANSFSGYKTNGFLQVREWPRATAITNTYPVYVFATDEIPERIEHATYEAAVRELNTPGSLLKDYTPNKYNKVSIDGALSVEYKSFNQSSETQIQIPKIEQLVSPLLNLNSAGFFSNLSGGASRT